MKKFIFLFLFSQFFVLITISQSLFRGGIFLHHSTGGCIWGPNGSSTDVPEQMAIYNANHGYTAQNAVTMDETWYPGWNDNEWSTWHSIFETDAPEEISGIMNTNKIVMIKSCFPSSEIWSIGSDEDTLDPGNKSIANYKWHWRHIVQVMENHPENFFVIWTNAPLEWYSTNPEQAGYSDWFCTWAKDTLAAGLDPVYGTFPRNVYVFDFFHKLADANGFLPAWYASGPWDSHPNAAATELVAPQLVNEIFDAAIAYESFINLDLKVFIEGPFSGTAMNTTINSIIPVSQPYNSSPWNYNGTENVTAIPNGNIVDWVLIELRDAPTASTAVPSTVIARQAAFLLSNGHVAGTDGTSMLHFNAAITQNLFVVIWHRNHLGIMSAIPLIKSGDTYSYDFSTGASKVYGGSAGHKQLAGGIWGMVSGDGNADGTISNTDKTNVWNLQVGLSGYLAGDFNMNGQVDNSDKTTKWKPNSGRGSQVPL